MGQDATAGDAISLRVPEVAGPLLGAGGSLLLLLAALLAILASSGLSRIAMLGLRFGIGAGRSVTRWAVVLRTIGWVLLLFCAVGWAAERLTATASLLLIACLFGLLTVTGTLRDLAGTLFAQLRLRLSEGDRIRIGDAEGEIRRMHWDHLSLRALDGQSVLVPGRALLSGVIRVQPLRDAILLERTIRTALSADALAQLADAITVCPYRVPETPMSVRLVDDGICFSLYVWSQQAASAAEPQLRAAIGAAQR